MHSAGIGVLLGWDLYYSGKDLQRSPSHLGFSIPFRAAITMNMVCAASKSCFQKTHCPLVLAEQGGSADPGGRGG